MRVVLRSQTSDSKDRHVFLRSVADWHRLRISISKTQPNRLAVIATVHAKISCLRADRLVVYLDSFVFRDVEEYPWWLDLLFLSSV